MRRHRTERFHGTTPPQSFQAWALGLIGTIITALILYYVRVAAIEHMVECQNHKLRAKREFEQKWTAGEFDQAKG
ncbi:hypothetical protein [Pseudomonas boanensis]|uniref:hypothetical protein n=1 Tax=Metapseudomonas boanensis TaxID=2822138 RepID=UPI0035D4F3A1